MYIDKTASNQRKNNQIEWPIKKIIFIGWAIGFSIALLLLLLIVIYKSYHSHADQYLESLLQNLCIWLWPTSIFLMGTDNSIWTGVLAVLLAATNGAIYALIAANGHWIYRACRMIFRRP